MNAPAGKSLIRRINRNRIVELVRSEGPIAQAELARRTGLSTAAVASIVGELKQDRLLEEAGYGPSATGKRPLLLRFNPAARLVLAAELSAERAEVALLDLAGTVLGGETFPADPAVGAEATLRLLAGRARGLMDSAGVDSNRVLGMGIAAESAVDAGQRKITLSANLGWRDVPAADLLEGELDLPVLVEGTALSMLWGEYLYGAGRQSETVVLVDVDSGIGARVMLEGREVRGAHHLAGELGHTVVEPDGRACVCGRRGCLETVATPRAMAGWIRGQLLAGRESSLRGGMDLGDREAAKAVFAAARAGDVLAVEAVSRVVDCLGRTISTLVGLIDPNMVILTGCMVFDGEGLIAEGVRRSLDESVLPVVAAGVAVRPGALRDRAALVGAAAMVCEREFRVPVQ